jgi:NTE family protein
MISDPMYDELNIQLFASMDRSDRHFFFEGRLHNLKMYFSLLKTIRTPSVFSAEAVDKIFSLYPDTDLSSLKIKFATIATDLISGREIVIDEGSLRQAVRASSSIPGFFPPVKMEHMLLVDGAATDSIPVQIVRGQGAQYVIAVDVSKCINDIGTLETGLQVIYRAEDIVSHHLTQERIAGVDYLIRPEVGHYSWADVGKMDEIIAAGEQAAQKAIPDIKRILGCK